MNCTRLIAAALSLLSFCALPAWAESSPGEFGDEFGKDVIREGVIDQDVYLAGERVDVRAQVNGDVVAAGGQVRIDNRVSGDIIAAGGRVEILAEVLDDVRAAGGEITVGNSVQGDVIAAGGHVRIEPSASVGERAWLAGGEIEVDGHVVKELRAAGGEITLSGRIDGDVTLIADSIRILPTAHIAGNLVYRAAQAAHISEQAVISGNITRLPFEHGGEGHDHGMSLIFLLALFVTGTVFYVLYPHFAVATVGTLGERPGASLGLGLVVLFVTPPLAMLLMITLIGGILGAVILVLYLLMLLAGFVTGMLFLGDGLLRITRQPRDAARGRRVLSLATAFLILWLLGFIPVIDTLLIFAATVLGTGALKLQMYRMYMAYREVEAGTPE